MWSLPPFPELSKASGIHLVDFQACNFGSARPKWTRLLCNFPELLALQGPCSGKHKEWQPGLLHQPWGLHHSGSWHFATAEEAEYPKELCQAVLAAVRKALARSTSTPAPLPGVDPKPKKRKPKLTSEEKAKNAARRAAMGLQSRGTPLPPLVGEWARVETRAVPQEALQHWSLAPGRLTLDTTVLGLKLKKGDKFFGLQPRTGTQGVAAGPWLQGSWTALGR